MVKELFFINLLSIVPKYYITSKTCVQKKYYQYTFLIPKKIDKPTIKLYLKNLFNIKIKSIKTINLKFKNSNNKKIILNTNIKLNIFN